jgi:transglutaminase-like putative cysteine protease
MTEYLLEHRTDYGYEAAVSTSYGRAHLHPRDIPGHQHAATATLTVSPEPHEQREHIDFYGNSSTYFVVSHPHTKLSVLSSCSVVVDRLVPEPSRLDELTSAEVAEALPPAEFAREFTLPSPMIPPAAAVADYARTIFGGDRPFGQTLRQLLDTIARDMTYQSGATTISTPLSEVLRTRKGVCQDFAHLAVGLLRTAGYAARYVSGYLETTPPPGQPKLQGADASHAWASVWTPHAGWVDIDPTNHQFVDDRYIVLGWGRDYADVPPLKGVIFTDAKRSTMQVSVDVARVGTPEAERLLR